MNKRGLGRGLDALIPDTSTLSPQEGEMILTVPIGAIEPNPLQPRKEFAETELAALAQSIREQGLLQPIVVRQTRPDVYQLIAGERRWRACERAGYERIPAIMRETSDDEMLPLALVENLIRENLNPMEEAEAFRELAEHAGWTQDTIAERVGKSRVHVANTLRLLRLPEEIREDVASNRISRGHARALLACVDEDAMFALRDRILEQGLTVRETEDGTGDASVAAPSPETGEPTAKRRRRSRRTTVRQVSPETRELELRFERVFGTPVQIHARGGRGRVSLEFYSWEDLDRLTELLLSADRSPVRPT